METNNTITLKEYEDYLRQGKPFFLFVTKNNCPNCHWFEYECSQLLKDGHIIFSHFPNHELNISNLENSDVEMEIYLRDELPPFGNYPGIFFIADGFPISQLVLNNLERLLDGYQAWLRESFLKSVTI